MNVLLVKFDFKSTIVVIKKLSLLRGKTHYLGNKDSKF